MCLIAFAWQAHPRFPLVVAGNRDEFFARPTAPATWWDDPEILAGRDLRAGGTWMGVNRSGRFAALTNHRDPSAQRPDAPSRGALVGDFLASTASPEAAVARIAADASRFNGFNLLAVQWTGPGCGAWIVAGPDGSASPIAPGVHAVSNARIDSAWPKVDYARTALGDTLAAGGDADALIARLFTVLEDRTIAADDRLPRTGVPLATERALSAPFIRMPGYGTRSTTVLVVDRDGRAIFVERRVEPDLPIVERRHDVDTTARAAAGQPSVTSARAP